VRRLVLRLEELIEIHRCGRHRRDLAVRRENKHDERDGDVARTWALHRISVRTAPQTSELMGFNPRPSTSDLQPQTFNLETSTLENQTLENQTLGRNYPGWPTPVGGVSAVTRGCAGDVGRTATKRVIRQTMPGLPQPGVLTPTRSPLPVQLRRPPGVPGFCGTPASHSHRDRSRGTGPLCPLPFALCQWPVALSLRPRALGLPLGPSARCSHARGHFHSRPSGGTICPFFSESSSIA